MRTVNEISNYITSNHYYDKKFDFSSVCSKLVETLGDDEEVFFACASATFFDGTEFFTTGVLVITNERMLYVAKTNTIFKSIVVKSFDLKSFSEATKDVPKNRFLSNCTIHFRFGRERFYICVPFEKVDEMSRELHSSIREAASPRKHQKNRGTANTNRKHTKTENKQNQSTAPSQKGTATAPQKDSTEVTFREGRNTFLASLIISIPIALVLSIFSPVLGVIAIIVFSVAFTIAHIKDKPARERKQARLDALRAQSFAMQFESSFRNGENPISSAPTIDTDRLRSDLMDYYGTAMHSGSPMAQADLVHVQGASEAELITEAKKSGFNLNKYMR